MAWLRLTRDDGRVALWNSDQAYQISERKDLPGAAVWWHGTLFDVRESVGEIATMIERAEWRERVLKCACAMMSNKHTNGLTEEQVWTRAARFAAMEPERPGVN